jgi:hypothetical protein
MKNQKFNINLTEWESYLIALLFKRITYEGVRENARDKEETENMINVIENVREQLAAQGMSPR